MKYKRSIAPAGLGQTHFGKWCSSNTGMEAVIQLVANLSTSDLILQMIIGRQKQPHECPKPTGQY